MRRGGETDGCMAVGKSCNRNHLRRTDCSGCGNHRQYGEKQEKRKIFLRLRMRGLPDERVLPFKAIKIRGRRGSLSASPADCGHPSDRSGGPATRGCRCMRLRFFIIFSGNPSGIKNGYKTGKSAYCTNHQIIICAICKDGKEFIKAQPLFLI